MSGPAKHVLVLMLASCLGAAPIGIDSGLGIGDLGFAWRHDEPHESRVPKPVESRIPNPDSRHNRTQDGQSLGAARSNFDQLLDLYVRDGFVYYRALKADRGKLDGFITAMAAAVIDSASREEQIAFWLNAYNAFVLRTVIDNYPIAQRAKEYPAHSIRQVPGAFERLPHRAAGRTMTLDQIELTILSGFRDPRLYLALGRGAVGSGRLRSEAFVPGRLQTQLGEVASECSSRPECVQIDRVANKLLVSALFSWREKEFVEAYAGSALQAFVERAPIERAVLAFVEPRLLTTEREFLAKNQFQMVYKPFDWSLNDLTGRGGR